MAAFLPSSPLASRHGRAQCPRPPRRRGDADVARRVLRGPGGDIGWPRVDEELLSLNEFLGAMGGFLEERAMYHGTARVRPAANEDPDSPLLTAEFARIWMDMPKVLCSRTLEPAGWNTTVDRAVDPDEVRRLQAEPDGDVVVGGGCSGRTTAPRTRG